ncbi:MAG: hypothetical protein IPJ54_10040 [Saprospiraceae bacterium]|nr:hypothetical protein [Saprospiraceae bacterium]
MGELFIFPAMLAYAFFHLESWPSTPEPYPTVSSQSVGSEIKLLKTLSVFMLVIVLLDLLAAQIHIINILI